MNDALRQETERLQRTWMTRDPAHLDSYLVSGPEDPRLNLQSLFSRHFLLRQLAGKVWDDLMSRECRFAAAMNWLTECARTEGDTEALAAVRHALEQDSDNAEGILVPTFLRRIFRQLPGDVCGLPVPNYITEFLEHTAFVSGKPILPYAGIDTFARLWQKALAREPAKPSATRLKVLEPACGSANDFRALHAFGIAERIDYTGFDLCETNIANARRLFPETRFQVGNIFEIPAPDREFDLCFMQDIFEHLSLAGLERALEEVCRVTRLGLCVGFFNLDDIPAHIERPYEEYHWNTLSVEQIRKAFLKRGFACRIRNVGAFLQEELGCEQTHNPNACTFLLWRPE